MKSHTPTPPTPPTPTPLAVMGPLSRTFGVQTASAKEPTTLPSPTTTTTVTATATTTILILKTEIISLPVPLVEDRQRDLLASTSLPWRPSSQPGNFEKIHIIPGKFCSLQ